MSTLQHFGKGTLRVVKNYTKGYSDTQAKVRDATSNDPWGPSGTQMNEIAQMSYNQNDFVEIVEMLDKRLNDKGKNWRHVFKSLTLIDYLLHAGSENVVAYFRKNLYLIKTLKEFQYLDEYGKDQGANVRQKAKDITNLLSDESRLREERRTRANMRERLGGSSRNGTGEFGLDGEEVQDEGENGRRRSKSMPSGSSRRGAGGDDDELRKAIEESKRTAAAEQAKAAATAEERDIARAIKLSEEEEERRRKAGEGGGSLFDEAQDTIAPLIDTSGPNLQPQFTQMQMQPQFTAFNPWQQQAQQEAMQADYMRQQAEWMRQQQEAAQLQAQQEAAQLQAQQEEWLRQQQQQQFMQQQQQQQQQWLVPQQQPILGQATGFGSNNPFAPSPSPFTASAPSLHTSLSSPGPNQPTPISFNLQGSYSSASSGPSYSSASGPSYSSSSTPSLSVSTPPTSSSAPPERQGSRGPSRADQEHAHLAGLFAARGDDGIDTFGNVGQLRYGPTQVGRVAAQKTGAPSHNPFAPQQQQQQQNNDQPFFSI